MEFLTLRAGHVSIRAQEKTSSHFFITKNTCHAHSRPFQTKHALKMSGKKTSLGKENGKITSLGKENGFSLLENFFSGKMGEIHFLKFFSVFLLGLGGHPETFPPLGNSI